MNYKIYLCHFWLLARLQSAYLGIRQPFNIVPGKYCSSRVEIFWCQLIGLKLSLAQLWYYIIWILPLIFSNYFQFSLPVAYEYF